MYQINIGDKILYYPGNSDYTAYDLELNEEVGKVGELTAKIPAQNPLYASVVQGSIITILKDGDEYWRGETRELNSDIEDIADIYCLEDLTWLADEYLPPSSITNETYAQRLQSVITTYNSTRPIDRQFTVGMITNVTSSDTCNWVTEYDWNILDSLRQNICKDTGYIRVRRVTTNGAVTRYIDIVRLEDYGTQATQPIEYGYNLLDYLKESDCQNLVNVLTPYGDELETEIYEGYHQRLQGTTISNADSITSYGRHAKAVIFDGVTELATLNALAAAYLTRYSQPQITMEVKAVDLGDIENVGAFKLGDAVRIIAEPFGIDQWLYHTQIKRDLQNVEKNVITLSGRVQQSNTLTNQTIDTAEMVKNLPSKASILTEAKANALRILNGTDGGIIYFISNSDNQITEQIIANNLDIDQATKAWRWNLNGLAYLHRTYPTDNWTVGIAITMDGQIVADYITTGTLNADLIKAGVISDVAGNFSLNMNDGTLVMRNGTFTGTINSTNGTIGAWTINANGISASVSSGASMLNPNKLGVTATNQVSNLATFKTVLDYSYAFLDYGGESSDGTNTWGGFYVAAQGNNNYVLPTLAHTRMSATQFTAYAGTSRYSIVSSTGFEFNQRAVGAAFYSNFSSGNSNIAIEGTYSSRLICLSMGSAWSYSDIGSGQYSDARLKEDIQDISSEKARAFFNGLRPVEFKFIADPSKRQYYGLIAQDLEQVLEDAEIVNDVIVVEDTSDDHYKQIYSNNYEAFVLKAVKDLYDLVEAQQDTINELRAEIERLKS